MLRVCSVFSCCFHVPFQTGIRTYGDDLRHGWFPSFDEDWSPDTYTSLNYPAGHFIPLRNCGILTTEGASRGAIGIT